MPSTKKVPLQPWERSGSVVEYLSRDRRAAGSSLTGVKNQIKQTKPLQPGSYTNVKPAYCTDSSLLPPKKLRTCSLWNWTYNTAIEIWMFNDFKIMSALLKYWKLGYQIHILRIYHVFKYWDLDFGPAVSILLNLLSAHTHSDITVKHAIIEKT